MQSKKWKEAMLGDIADEITVGFVGTMASEYVSEGIPFLRSQNVEPFVINRNDIKYITPEFHKKIKKSALQPGDVVIVRTGKPGACAVIPEWLHIANCSDLVIIRSGKGLDPYFLAYYINAVASNHVSAHLVGAVQQHFNVGSARNIRLALPDLAEQRAIAGILGALDDKIELNQRMNRTLESMARAVFRQWFVESEEVRDWDIGRLDDLLVLQRGFDLPTPQRIPGQYPVLAASGPSGTHNEYKVKGPGVTTGRSGVIGQVFFVHEDFWPLNTSLWIKEFKLAKPTFAYYLLNTLDFAMFNSGSAVPTLNRNHVHNLPLSIPPLELIERFEDFAMPLLRMVYANEKESRTLASLRDSLLPKLMRGEVRVKGYEGIA